MNTPAALVRQPARSFALRGIAAALITLGALGTAGLAAAQTTTLGTRGHTAVDNSTPLTTNASSTWKEYSRAAEYPNILTLPLQFITMPNGQKLAVRVTVPADAKGQAVAGTFPAILTQTAYRIDVGQLLGYVVQTGNSLLIGGQDKFMIQRGYVSVAVDVLGTGMSSGQGALLGEPEQQGYAAAVDWVTQQPWFNGKLGLAGTSYLGITSLQTASQQHPAVKAVFAQVPMGDAYRGTVGIGGLLNAEFISLWLTLTQALSVQNDIAKINFPEWAGQIDIATQDHIAAIDSWYLPTVDKSLNGETGYATDDGDFWAVRSPVEGAGQIKVPTFIVGASNDIFQRDEPLIYEQLKRNVNTKLIVYKGSHLESVLAAASGANTLLGNGAPGSASLMLQWFDQYLRGMNTGAASLPNVTQFVEGFGVLGSTRYAKATDWPHPQMTPQRLYLRGNQTLTTAKPGSGETAHFIKEPKAPVVTYGKSDSGKTVNAKVEINDGSDCSSSYVQWSLGAAGLLPKACYTNSNTVEKSQGAIIFETPYQSSNLYLNGPIQADLWVSTTRPEAAVSVRVDVVDILGKATPLSTGLLAVSHRAVDTSRSRYVKGVMIQPWHPFTEAARLPVIPGQPMQVSVEVFPMAALIRPGQKLRVAISASNQAMGVWAKPQQALADGNVTTLYNDAARPSSVVLPVVPASALN